MNSYDGDPEKIAQSILDSTITASDSQIDYQPSLRRVKYDLEEVDKQIKEKVVSNTVPLVKTVEKINKCGTLTASLAPDLENVTSEYARLQREFIAPYEHLQKVYKAAQHLHQTSVLVRSFNWYLGMAKELDQNMAALEGASKSSTAQPQAKLVTNGSETKDVDSKAVYTAATLVSKLENLLVANTHLQSLKVVREHEKTLKPIRTKLISLSLRTVKEFDGSQNSLRSAILTLCIFDTESLLTSVDSWLKSQTSSSVLSLTRSVSTKAGFDSAWSQCTARASCAGQMSQVLEECYLLTRTENKVGGPIVDTFWNLVASNVSQKLHTMSVANPGQIKAMKTHAEHILELTREVSVMQAAFKKYL